MNTAHETRLADLVSRCRQTLARMRMHEIIIWNGTGMAPTMGPGEAYIADPASFRID